MWPTIHCFVSSAAPVLLWKTWKRLGKASPGGKHQILNPKFETMSEFSKPKFSKRLELLSFEMSIANWPCLWTQAALALEGLQRPPAVLFVPAHTIPILRFPGLKTLVTI